ncbi:calcium-activated potassium channel subunit beta-3 [Dunckerocampus dactyliophorus]|uniref:calcium-activated potassium channel subunit beta-3 n=1 Tax=Dunckerocampus dactyliophorus TaxID=161453 RepID=UPI0024052562|nr:calcium-activated potassium channel subunit beta-3 [Dunckerocampus dactyliophorus]
MKLHAVSLMIKEVSQVTREVLHTVTAQEQDRSRGADGHDGHNVRTPVAVSSVGEDRAILLGFSMMAFSVLMFFVVGITMVKPHINSKWEEEDRCMLLHAEILDEWVDCRGVSTIPCLTVTVHLTASNQSALLHFDEESVLLTPKCFYVPKCQMDQKELEGEVLKVKSNLDAQLGSTSSCLTDPTRHPGDVILSRKYTLRRTLLALLWPSLMLGGGALLVGLVKLTQCLAHLSSEICSVAAGGRLAAKYTHGKFYKIIQRSTVSSAM